MLWEKLNILCIIRSVIKHRSDIDIATERRAKWGQRDLQILFERCKQNHTDISIIEKILGVVDHRMCEENEWSDSIKEKRGNEEKAKHVDENEGGRWK